MNEQSKREMMIEAAVKFEGKWPKFEGSGKERWSEGEKGLAVCILDFFEGEKHSVGDIGKVIISDCCKTFWQPFCNQQEFEAFMDELSDKAPEGATHYLPSNKYYYVRRNHAYCFVNEYGVHHHAQLDESAFDSLIPLPKREPAPWMPEVGQDFEWMLDGVSEKWHYGYFVGLDKDGDMVIQREDKLDGLNTTKKNHNYKFRPLRTEAEIERERLFKVVFDAVNPNGMTYYDKEVFGDFVSELIDAGVIK